MIHKLQATYCYYCIISIFSILLKYYPLTLIIKKSHSLSKPRTGQRLANKKAPKDKPTAESVVGDSLGLPKPLNDLVGPASGYT